ncbi:phytanoyl-CoA dioxygenase family protein [Thalassospira sp.]|uniref:phytanoyl-CoA dioxygenase family protein n=1 Tax=Thalassospira sp. TaxID=1912094 RepID=UPI0032EAC6C1
MITGTEYYVFDKNASDFSLDAALEQFKREGFVVLRNSFPAEQLIELQQQAELVMSRPALNGTRGYYWKHQKKVFDAFMLGRSAVHAILNEDIIHLSKRYLGSEINLVECFLKRDESSGEVYFPFHSDFHIGWKAKDIVGPLEQKDFDKPFATGAMVYLHDTVDGAFCYAKGTQHLPPVEQSTLACRTAEEQQLIMDNLVRVEGKAGDIAIFDDRGFHGPDQPYISDRTVLIYDFYSQNFFGDFVKAEMPIFVSDLGGLSELQKSALGFDASVAFEYDDYHVHLFPRYHPRTYKMLTLVMNICRKVARLRRQLSLRLSRLRN